jgi:uncharacterized protein (TIGR03086 family)
MSEIADRYRRLSGEFTETVAGVPDDKWDAPTPCEDWDARQLVQHVVDSHKTFLGFIGEEIDPPPVADGPMAAWTVARDAVQGALDDPATASKSFTGMFGETTFENSVDRFLSFDQVIHRWDLARATLQDENILDEDVERLTAQLPSFGDAMRGPSAFGPEVEAPAGADAQDRLLAFLGRTP